MFFITKFKSRCVIFQVGLSFSFYLLLMDEFLYQLIGTLSHYYRFYTSEVVQDFVHQQYEAGPCMVQYGGGCQSLSRVRTP